MKLKSYLSESKINIKDIAKKANISNYYMGQKIKNPSKLNLKQILIISEELGLDLIDKNTGKNIEEIFN